MSVFLLHYYVVILLVDCIVNKIIYFLLIKKALQYDYSAFSIYYYDSSLGEVIALITSNLKP